MAFAVQMIQLHYDQYTASLESAFRLPNPGCEKTFNSNGGFSHGAVVEYGELDRHWVVELSGCDGLKKFMQTPCQCYSRATFGC